MSKKFKLFSVMAIIITVLITCCCGVIFSAQFSYEQLNNIYKESLDEENATNNLGDSNSANFNNSQSGSLPTLNESVDDLSLAIGQPSNWDDLEDGDVPSGYTPTGTAISTEAQLKSFLQGTTAETGYLTTNISMSWGNKAPDDADLKNRTLDGNGKTITITGNYGTGWTIYNPGGRGLFGFFIHELWGTIKNTKFERTGAESKITSNSNADLRLGLIAGMVETTGVFENCKVTNSAPFEYHLYHGSGPGDWSMGFYAGLNRGLITNCTTAGTAKFYMNSKSGQTSVGGFVGTMDNILGIVQNATFNFTGQLQQNAANSAYRKSAIVGDFKGGYINGVIFKNVPTYDGERSDVAHFADDALANNISNIYYAAGVPRGTGWLFGRGERWNSCYISLQSGYTARFSKKEKDKLFIKSNSSNYIWKTYQGEASGGGVTENTLSLVDNKVLVSKYNFTKNSTDKNSGGVLTMTNANSQQSVNFPSWSKTYDGLNLGVPNAPFTGNANNQSFYSLSFAGVSYAGAQYNGVTLPINAGTYSATLARRGVDGRALYLDEANGIVVPYNNNNIVYFSINKKSIVPRTELGYSDSWLNKVYDGNTNVKYNNTDYTVNNFIEKAFVTNGSVAKITICTDINAKTFAHPDKNVGSRSANITFVLDDTSSNYQLSESSIGSKTFVISPKPLNADFKIDTTLSGFDKPLNLLKTENGEYFFDYLGVTFIDGNSYFNLANFMVSDKDIPNDIIGGVIKYGNGNSDKKDRINAGRYLAEVLSIENPNYVLSGGITSGYYNILPIKISKSDLQFKLNGGLVSPNINGQFASKNYDATEHTFEITWSDAFYGVWDGKKIEQYLLPQLSLSIPNINSIGFYYKDAGQHKFNARILNQSGSSSGAYLDYFAGSNFAFDGYIWNGDQSVGFEYSYEILRKELSLVWSMAYDSYEAVQNTLYYNGQDKSIRLLAQTLISGQTVPSDALSLIYFSGKLGKSADRVNVAGDGFYGIAIYNGGLTAWDNVSSGEFKGSNYKLPGDEDITESVNLRNHPRSSAIQAGITTIKPRQIEMFLKFMGHEVKGNYEPLLGNTNVYNGHIKRIWFEIEESVALGNQPDNLAKNQLIRDFNNLDANNKNGLGVDIKYNGNNRTVYGKFNAYLTAPTNKNYVLAESRTTGVGTGRNIIVNGKNTTNQTADSAFFFNIDKLDFSIVMHQQYREYGLENPLFSYNILVNSEINNIVGNSIKDEEFATLADLSESLGLLRELGGIDSLNVLEGSLGSFDSYGALVGRNTQPGIDPNNDVGYGVFAIKDAGFKASNNNNNYTSYTIKEVIGTNEQGKHNAVGGYENQFLPNATMFMFKKVLRVDLSDGNSRMFGEEFPIRDSSKVTLIDGYANGGSLTGYFDVRGNDGLLLNVLNFNNSSNIYEIARERKTVGDYAILTKTVGYPAGLTPISRGFVDKNGTPNNVEVLQPSSANPLKIEYTDSNSEKVNDTNNYLIVPFKVKEVINDVRSYEYWVNPAYTIIPRKVKVSPVFNEIDDFVYNATPQVKTLNAPDAMRLSDNTAAALKFGEQLSYDYYAYISPIEVRFIKSGKYIGQDTNDNKNYPLAIDAGMYQLQPKVLYSIGTKESPEWVEDTVNFEFSVNEETNEYVKTPPRLDFEIAKKKITYNPSTNSGDFKINKNILSTIYDGSNWLQKGIDLVTVSDFVILASVGDGLSGIYKRDMYNTKIEDVIRQETDANGVPLADENGQPIYTYLYTQEVIEPGNIVKFKYDIEYGRNENGNFISSENMINAGEYYYRLKDTSTTKNYDISHLSWIQNVFSVDKRDVVVTALDDIWRFYSDLNFYSDIAGVMFIKGDNSLSNKITQLDNRFFVVDNMAFIGGVESSGKELLKGALSVNALRTSIIGFYEMQIGNLVVSNPNYNVSIVNGVTFEIKASPISISITDKVKIYGDAVPNLSYSIIEGLFIPSDLIGIMNTTVTKYSEVLESGYYDITFTPNNNNYQVTIMGNGTGIDGMPVGKMVVVKRELQFAYNRNNSFKFNDTPLSINDRTQGFSVFITDYENNKNIVFPKVEGGKNLLPLITQVLHASYGEVWQQVGEYEIYITEESLIAVIADTDFDGNAIADKREYLRKNYNYNIGEDNKVIVSIAYKYAILSIFDQMIEYGDQVDSDNELNFKFYDEETGKIFNESINTEIFGKIGLLAVEETYNVGYHYNAIDIKGNQQPDWNKSFIRENETIAIYIDGVKNIFNVKVFKGNLTVKKKRLLAIWSDTNNSLITSNKNNSAVYDGTWQSVSVGFKPENGEFNEDLNKPYGDDITFPTGNANKIGIVNGVLPLLTSDNRTTSEWMVHADAKAYIGISTTYNSTFVVEAVKYLNPLNNDNLGAGNIDNSFDSSNFEIINEKIDYTVTKRQIKTKVTNIGNSKKLNFFGMLNGAETDISSRVNVVANILSGSGSSYIDGTGALVINANLGNYSTFAISAEMKTEADKLNYSETFEFVYLENIPTGTAGYVSTSGTWHNGSNNYQTPTTAISLDSGTSLGNGVYSQSLGGFNNSNVGFVNENYNNTLKYEDNGSTLYKNDGAYNSHINDAGGFLYFDVIIPTNLLLLMQSGQLKMALTGYAESLGWAVGAGVLWNQRWSASDNVSYLIRNIKMGESFFNEPLDSNFGMPMKNNGGRTANAILSTNFNGTGTIKKNAQLLGGGGYVSGSWNYQDMFGSWFNTADEGKNANDDAYFNVDSQRMRIYFAAIDTDDGNGGKYAEAINFKMRNLKIFFKYNNYTNTQSITNSSVLSNNSVDVLEFTLDIRKDGGFANYIDFINTENIQVYYQLGKDDTGYVPEGGVMFSSNPTTAENRKISVKVDRVNSKITVRIAYVNGFAKPLSVQLFDRLGNAYERYYFNIADNYENSLYSTPQVFDTKLINNLTGQSNITFRVRSGDGEDGEIKFSQFDKNKVLLKEEILTTYIQSGNGYNAYRTNFVDGAESYQIEVINKAYYNAPNQTEKEKYKITVDGLVMYDKKDNLIISAGAGDLKIWELNGTYNYDWIYAMTAQLQKLSLTYGNTYGRLYFRYAVFPQSETTWEYSKAEEQLMANYWKEISLPYSSSNNKIEIEITQLLLHEITADYLASCKLGYANDIAFQFRFTNSFVGTDCFEDNGIISDIYRVRFDKRVYRIDFETSFHTGADGVYGSLSYYDTESKKEESAVKTYDPGAKNESGNVTGETVDLFYNALDRGNATLKNGFTLQDIKISFANKEFYVLRGGWADTWLTLADTQWETVGELKEFTKGKSILNIKSNDNPYGTTEANISINFANFVEYFVGEYGGEYGEDISQEETDFNNMAVTSGTSYKFRNEGSLEYKDLMIAPNGVNKFNPEFPELLDFIIQEANYPGSTNALEKIYYYKSQVFTEDYKINTVYTDAQVKDFVITDEDLALDADSMYSSRKSQIVKFLPGTKKLTPRLLIFDPKLLDPSLKEGYTNDDVDRSKVTVSRQYDGTNKLYFDINGNSVFDQGEEIGAKHFRLYKDPSKVDGVFKDGDAEKINFGGKFTQINVSNGSVFVYMSDVNESESAVGYYQLVSPNNASRYVCVHNEEERKEPSKDENGNILCDHSINYPSQVSERLLFLKGTAESVEFDGKTYNNVQYNVFDGAKHEYTQFIVDNQLDDEQFSVTPNVGQGAIRVIYPDNQVPMTAGAHPLRGVEFGRWEGNKFVKNTNYAIDPNCITEVQDGKLVAIPRIIIDYNNSLRVQRIPVDMVGGGNVSHYIKLTFDNINANTDLGGNYLGVQFLDMPIPVLLYSINDSPQWYGIEKSRITSIVMNNITGSAGNKTGELTLYYSGRLGAEPGVLDVYEFCVADRSLLEDNPNYKPTTNIDGTFSSLANGQIELNEFVTNEKASFEDYIPISNADELMWFLLGIGNNGDLDGYRSENAYLVKDISNFNWYNFNYKKISYTELGIPYYETFYLRDLDENSDEYKNITEKFNSGIAFYGNLEGNGYTVYLTLDVDTSKADKDAEFKKLKLGTVGSNFAFSSGELNGVTPTNSWSNRSLFINENIGNINSLNIAYMGNVFADIKVSSNNSLDEGNIYLGTPIGARNIAFSVGIGLNKGTIYNSSFENRGKLDIVLNPLDTEIIEGVTHTVVGGLVAINFNGDIINTTVYFNKNSKTGNEGVFAIRDYRSKDSVVYFGGLVGISSGNAVDILKTGVIGDQGFIFLEAKGKIYGGGLIGFASGGIVKAIKNNFLSNIIVSKQFHSTDEAVNNNIFLGVAVGFAQDSSGGVSNVSDLIYYFPKGTKTAYEDFALYKDTLCVGGSSASSCNIPIGNAKNHNVVAGYFNPEIIRNKNDKGVYTEPIKGKVDFYFDKSKELVNGRPYEILYEALAQPKNFIWEIWNNEYLKDDDSTNDNYYDSSNSIFNYTDPESDGYSNMTYELAGFAKTPDGKLIQWNNTYAYLYAKALTDNIPITDSNRNPLMVQVYPTRYNKVVNGDNITYVYNENGQFAKLSINFNYVVGNIKVNIKSNEFIKIITDENKTKYCNSTGADANFTLTKGFCFFTKIMDEYFEIKNEKFTFTQSGSYNLSTPDDSEAVNKMGNAFVYYGKEGVYNYIAVELGKYDYSVEKNTYSVSADGTWRKVLNPVEGGAKYINLKDQDLNFYYHTDVDGNGEKIYLRVIEYSKDLKLFGLLQEDYYVGIEFGKYEQDYETGDFILSENGRYRFFKEINYYEEMISQAYYINIGTDAEPVYIPVYINVHNANYAGVLVEDITHSEHFIRKTIKRKVITFGNAEILALNYYNSVRAIAFGNMAYLTDNTGGGSVNDNVVSFIYNGKDRAPEVVDRIVITDPDGNRVEDITITAGANKELITPGEYEFTYSIGDAELGGKYSISNNTHTIIQNVSSGNSQKVNVKINKATTTITDFNKLSNPEIVTREYDGKTSTVITNIESFLTVYYEGALPDDKREKLEIEIVTASANVGTYKKYDNSTELINSDEVILILQKRNESGLYPDGKVANRYELQAGADGIEGEYIYDIIKKALVSATYKNTYHSYREYDSQTNKIVTANVDKLVGLVESDGGLTDNEPVSVDNTNKKFVVKMYNSADYNAEYALNIGTKFTDYTQTVLYPRIGVEENGLFVENYYVPKISSSDTNEIKESKMKNYPIITFGYYFAESEEYLDNAVNRVFKIETKNDIDMLNHKTPIGNNFINFVDSTLDKHIESNYNIGSYLQKNNINMNGAMFTPIDNFNGAYDGDGFAISNFKIINTDATSPIGFFNTVGENGVLKNINLEKFSYNIYGTNLIVGGLVGEFSGKSITNCFVYGNIYAGDSNTQTLIVGGLIGKLTNAEGILNVGGMITKNTLLTFVGAEGLSVTYGGLIGYIENGRTITDNKLFAEAEIFEYNSNNSYSPNSSVDDTQVNSGYVVGKANSEQYTESLTNEYLLDSISYNHMILNKLLTVPQNAIDYDMFRNKAQAEIESETPITDMDKQFNKIVNAIDSDILKTWLIGSGDKNGYKALGTKEDRFKIYISRQTVLFNIYSWANFEITSDIIVMQQDIDVVDFGASLGSYSFINSMPFYGTISTDTIIDEEGVSIAQLRTINAKFIGSTNSFKAFSDFRGNDVAISANISILSM